MDRRHPHRQAAKLVCHHDQQHHGLLHDLCRRHHRWPAHDLLLLSNGFQIAVVATYTSQHHMALNLFSFMAAHGALEIPAIMLAGAAGLRLGSGILFPGLLRRRDSIAQGGVDSVQLISGTIPLLIVAGTFEAFMSPTHIPIALKFATCAILFAGLCWWLGEGGRKTVANSADDGA